MKLSDIAIVSGSLLSGALAITTPNHLQLTALLSTKEDLKARFECWEIAQPFSSYPTVGQAISGLANVSNISYVVLPPRSDEGLHKAPHPMFFVLLSGTAHVTLPEGDDDLWIVEGVHGLIIAADVYGIGHYTQYPSDKASVALQLPFEDGRMPQHRVVNKGLCKVETKLDTTSPTVEDALARQQPLEHESSR